MKLSAKVALVILIFLVGWGMVVKFGAGIDFDKWIPSVLAGYIAAILISSMVLLYSQKKNRSLRRTVSRLSTKNV